MSNLSADAGRGRRLRADAIHSRTTILDAAVRVLNRDPEAAVTEIARTAGLTRQTVYAHFPTRQILVDAVITHATQALADLIDTEAHDSETPTQALTRFLDIGWQLVDRYPLLLRLAASSGPQESRQRHEPVLERFETLIRAGQDRGDFDPHIPSDWLLTAAIALTDTAGAQVAAGRLTAEQAKTLTRQAILRVFGAQTEAGSVPTPAKTPRKSPAPRSGHEPSKGH